MLHRLVQAGCFALFTTFALNAARAQQSGDQGASGVEGNGAASGHIISGDQITIKVAREPDLGGKSLTVDERGDITLARLGSVRVTSLNVSSLRDTLTLLYGTFLRNPVVDVTALRRIIVNGEVMKPDVYLVDVTMTLRDVVAHAGGISQTGDPRKVMLIRAGHTFPVANWEVGGNLGGELQSADEIFVGRRSWISLNAATVVGIAGILASLFIAFHH